jgi:hypothetical protein
MIDAQASEAPLSIFSRFLKFGLLAWGGACCTDRDDQARVRR